MEILRASNLGFAYDYTLFNNINLTLNQKQSIAITGVSGCGKSTLLHILSTLLKPNFGEVIYQDRSIYELSQNELLAIRRLHFGIIFQSHYLFKGFSAYENIELASILSGENIEKNDLKALKISSVINQKVGELSGGQQQRGRRQCEAEAGLQGIFNCVDKVVHGTADWVMVVGAAGGAV